MTVVQRRPGDEPDDLAAYQDPRLRVLTDSYVAEVIQSHEHEMRGAENLAGAILYLGANMNQRFTAVDARMDGLETRMDGLEVRMSGLETRMDGLEVRMGALEVRMDRMELKQDLMMDEIRVMRAGIEKLTAWIMRDELKD
jgi:uncharacterized coiled-coil protein SlyX